MTQSGLNCGVTSAAAAITTTAAPTFSTQPAASQTVCLDGTVNALTVAYQNGTGTPTYQWYSNTTNSNTGGVAISGATGSSYTPPTTANGTMYYYCIVNFGSGGCSLITSSVASVTVNPDPTITVQPIPSQMICVGGTISPALSVTYSGGVGTASYQWQAGGVNISGATSSTFTPTNFTSTGTNTYTVVITLSGSGCNVMTSQNAQVEVIPDPTISLQPIGSSYCQNAAPVSALSVSATGGTGSFSYQWYSSATNTTSGGAAISGATSSSYTPPVTTVGTVYYYCVVTQSGLNCGVTSAAAAIVVTPVASIINQPLNQTVCLDGNFNQMSVAYQNGTGIPNYQWYSNTTNSTIDGTLLSGETNPTYQPSSNIAGLTYFYCTISFNSGGCSLITSQAAFANVLEDPIISVQPIPTESICIGGTISTPLIVSYTGGFGNPTYQWQLNNQNIVGATQNNYLPPNFDLPGIFNYNVNISLSGSGCNSMNSQTVLISVYDDPTVNDPIDAVYCQYSNSVEPLIVSATGGSGSFSYQWYSSSTNTNAGGSIISGATLSSFLPPVNLPGIVYYYCSVAQSGANCSVVSNPASVEINLPPSISQQPLASQNLCIGGTPILLSVSYINGNGSASYQWYESTSNSTIGGSPIIGATSNTYLPSSLIAGESFYYCVISFQVGGCSNVVSNAAQVNVLNDPIITNQPIVSQMICQGMTLIEPLSFSYSGGTGNSTISWFQVGSPDILINGVIGTSFQPTTFNTSGTYEYYAVVSVDGQGCDNATTLLSEIIVNPTPQINNLNDTVVCNNSVLEIDISTNVPSNIQWYANPNSNVEGELFTTQTSQLISDSLTNNSTNPQFITYNITPTSFPYGCIGPDSIVIVQIQPDVILSMETNIEICSGSPVNAILTANIPSNFNWFVTIDNPNVTGESIQSSTSNLITDALVNNSNVNQVVIYSVYPTSILGSCNGLAQTLVVSVKPPLNLLNEDTLTICSGSNLNLSLIANTNVTFNWYADQAPNVLNESTTVITSPLINDNLVNNTYTVQQVNYHVIGTSTSNGCSSPILPIVVYVNPIPQVYPLNDTVLCNAINFSPISFDGPVLGTNYNWTATNTSIGISAQNGINSTPGFITTNNTFTLQESTINVIPTFTFNNASCAGNLENFTISIVPTASVYPLPDISICNGGQVPTTMLSGPIPGSQFNWTNSNTGISLNASGVGDVPSFIASNPSSTQQFSTVFISPFLQEGNVQCIGQIEDYLITVYPSPQMENTDIEICSGENTNILLNANITSTYEWYANPTMNVYNETSFPIQNDILINDYLISTTMDPQTVDYLVTPTSQTFGCVGPESIITVIVNPLPLVDFSVLNMSLCDMQPVNFQNNSQGFLDFSWNFGDNDSSFLINPSHIYSAVGTYIVELNGTDQLTGCSNSIESSLIISETPHSSFNYSDSLGCGNLDVIFSADSLNPNWSYSWNFGDGQTSQQWGVSGYQFMQSGCYDISLTLTSNNGCSSILTETNAICVIDNPVASFNVNNQVISTLEPIVAFNNTSYDATSYLWQFGDNTTSIVENPIHEYPADPALYEVLLIASNNIGCVDTAIMTILLYQELEIYVPNTFTPNDDEYNQVFLPVLTDGFKESSYVLYIFNRWGELIFESHDHKIGWDGTYGGQLFDCQTGTYTWKISVEVLQTGERKLFHGHVNLIK